MSEAAIIATGAALLAALGMAIVCSAAAMIDAATKNNERQDV
jgi:F0F1-type ATP synthase membrane subunit c/vacuolar-type H+-ATPase subunit K